MGEPDYSVLNIRVGLDSDCGLLDFRPAAVEHFNPIYGTAYTPETLKEDGWWATPFETRDAVAFEKWYQDTLKTWPEDIVRLARHRELADLRRKTQADVLSSTDNPATIEIYRELLTAYYARYYNGIPLGINPVESTGAKVGQPYLIYLDDSVSFAGKIPEFNRKQRDPKLKKEVYVPIFPHNDGLIKEGEGVTTVRAIDETHSVNECLRLMARRVDALQTQRLSELSSREEKAALSAPKPRQVAKSRSR